MTDETYIKATLAGVMALTGLTVMGWALGGAESAERAAVRTACLARGMEPMLQIHVSENFQTRRRPICVDKTGALYALD